MYIRIKGHRYHLYALTSLRISQKRNSGTCCREIVQCVVLSRTLGQLVTQMLIVGLRYLYRGGWMMRDIQLENAAELFDISSARTAKSYGEIQDKS